MQNVNIKMENDNVKLKNFFHRHSERSVAESKNLSDFDNAITMRFLDKLEMTTRRYFNTLQLSL